MMSQFLRLAAAAAIAAASAIVPLTAQAAVTGHLYVATGGKPLEIDRFPLNDGLPSAQPDLRIPGWYIALAVGPDGTLYGFKVNNDIDAFAPGQTTPERTINFPNLGSFLTIGGLAIDKKGYLFVAYSTYFSGARARFSTRTHTDVSYPALGAVAYAPGASGHAQPVSAVALNGQYVNGVAVDGHDRLFISNGYNNRVPQFSHAVRDPDPAGYLAVSMSYPESLRVDGEGSLYELDGAYLTKNGVLVYAPGSGKSTPPASAIIFAKQYQYVRDIAVWGKYLYASDFGYTSTIDVYVAGANGPQNPVLSQSEPQVNAIAAGP
jgi:hypothetical protein